MFNDEDSKNPFETFNAFLLTDGEDSPERILNLVYNQTKPNFRLYTLGIGDGCSQYLLKRIAEVGNGKCQFVTDYEDINAKVIDLLEDSMTQYLEGFKLYIPDVEISQIIPDPESIISIKKKYVVIQILFPTPIQQTLDFQIKFYDPQKQVQIFYTQSLKVNESLQQDYFHKLAAHKFINYYENSFQNTIKQVNSIKVNQKILNNEDIINLSLQNQILCSKTAYICEVCHLEDDLKQLIQEKIFYQNPKRNQKQDYQYQLYSIDICCDYYKQYQSCFRDMLFSDIECCKLMPVECEPSDMSQFNNNDQYLLEKQIKIEQKDEENEKRISQIQISSHNKNIIENSRETVFLINYVDLLQCVQANGCFILEYKITDSIKLKSLNNHNNYEYISWTTIIALFYLELHCQNDKASWQLIYQKAILYLKKTGLDYFKIITEHYNNYQQLFEFPK